MGIFVGNDDDNQLIGTDGADTIIGKAGNDLLKGHGGKDYLDAGDGNDKIIAGAGSDLIYGGYGNDNINGGKGNDLIYGGFGNDKMTGGPGKDSFFFEGGSSGKDFILDFTDNVDKLYISKSYGFKTVDDVIAAAHPSGGDTPIDLSGHGNQHLQIILLNYDHAPSTLANDIILIA
jgi:Ca2+-binding RTX toxin-like protein